MPYHNLEVAKAPFWYLVAFLGVYAAIFGLRWLIAPLVTKLMAPKNVEGIK